MLLAEPAVVAAGDNTNGNGPLVTESHRSIEQSRVQSGRSRPNEYRCFALIASGAGMLPLLPPPPPLLLLQIEALLFDAATAAE